MAKGDRSVRRGRRRVRVRCPSSPKSVAILLADDGLGRAPAAVRDAAVPAAPVGRLLARRRPVARAATRPLLGRTPADKPQRDALGRRAARCWSTYRLIAPGSEWRLHRQWFLDGAMADLLGRRLRNRCGCGHRARKPHHSGRLPITTRSIPARSRRVSPPTKPRLAAIASTSPAWPAPTSRKSRPPRASSDEPGTIAR